MVCGKGIFIQPVWPQVPVCVSLARADRSKHSPEGGRGAAAAPSVVPGERVEWQEHGQLGAGASPAPPTPLVRWSIDFFLIVNIANSDLIQPRPGHHHLAVGDERQCEASPPRRPRPMAVWHAPPPRYILYRYDVAAGMTSCT